VIDANRACFDAELRGASVVTAQSDALRDGLRKALEETAELRAQLVALRESTTWRMTAPLRHALERLKGPSPEIAPAPVPEPAAYVPFSYTEWVGGPEAALKQRLTRDLPGISKVWAPRLALVELPGGSASPAQQEGCVVVHPGEADVFEFALGLNADFIGFHDPRDRLAPEALTIMRDALARAPQTALAFADEDWLDETGARTAPFFKPGWDAELARGRDLIGVFAFFSARLLRAAVRSDGAAWRLVLAQQIVAMAEPDQILHVPAVLCHRGAPPPPVAAALAAQLAQQGQARLEALPDTPGLHRVIYDLPVEPLVSILICTRDRADLLRACMDGLLYQTDYERFEVILIDNDSTAPDALALLDALAADPRVKRLRAPGAFNWAALNNAAASQAAGEILLLLNNDITVLDRGWLRELVAQAMQPGVGAVGAKLLYPDGRVQHAGLSVNDIAVPTHLFRYAAADAPGMCDLMRLAREVWAVTGACMAVPRAAFEALGGLNEALPVACNDVEFCLRLGALGYRVIFTPWAVLTHHEQATRLPDDTDEKRQRARGELDRLLRDWGVLALVDPYLNPNLMLFEEQPILRDLAVRS
jgi:GT2 family glycosyltransferase